jgi:adenylosuccinate synthase
LAYCDLVADRYAALKGGINSLVITKLDILNGNKSIKVCSSYGRKMNSVGDFTKDIVPAYVSVPGWNDSKNIEQITPFIRFVEEVVGLKVEYVSTGVNKEDIIKL